MCVSNRCLNQIPVMWECESRRVRQTWGGRRRGQSVDIQKKKCILGNEISEAVFHLLGKKRRKNTTPSSPFPPSLSPILTTLFYSSFNQFHFSPADEQMQQFYWSGFPWQRAVARQPATLHHPFQKSDRWERGRGRRGEREREDVRWRMKKKNVEEKDEGEEGIRSKDDRQM